MNETHQPLPMARQSQLITREVAGEMLVYDRNRDEAHCLNPTAAFIWAHCDGETTVAEMARLLAGELQTPVADEVVWLALEQLRKARLLPEPVLQEPLTRPAQVEQMSRRALVRRLGVAAAVTLPLVTSIVAPSAAAAASCLPAGSTCTANADCCSNGCVDNGRGVFQCT
jgi:hypothetical protein